MTWLQAHDALWCLLALVVTLQGGLLAGGAVLVTYIIFEEYGL